MSDTSPAARRAYLAGLDEQAERLGRQPPRGDDFLARLAAAEDRLALADADWDAAARAAADARADLPGWEHAHARYLNPDERHRYVVMLGAEEGLRQAEQAYHSARSRLNQMLATYEQISQPDLGLPPGPGDEPWHL
jgi:hypothetical protein